jgi:murein L,D-transpeptidase YafK
MRAPEEFSIVVQKGARALLLYAGGCVERTYPVTLGRNWAADKSVEGDEATPLGEFYVCAKNPRSKYFLSLCISYPNGEDADRGLAAGLISAAEHAQIHEALRMQRMPPQHTRLGGEIYIHGAAPAPAGPANKDWTRGCIALENPAMQELYGLVSVGTPVVIVA